MKGGNMPIEKIKEYAKIFLTGCSNTSAYQEHPTDCEECLQAFAKAVEGLYLPKPSTDFSVPKANLGEYFLFYRKLHKQWYAGQIVLRGAECYMVDVELFDLVPLSNFSHWLPMPDHPTDD